MNKKITYRKDYRKPDFQIPTTNLEFEIFEKYVTVKSCLNIKAISDCNTLRLNGENLEINSISLDGKKLEPSEYNYNDNILEINNVPEMFILQTSVNIDPFNNTSLEGLYRSGSILCSQNEPEGFRHITFFIDRPDVMSHYTTSIVADKNKYPCLLSNGNMLSESDLDNNRHQVLWRDPFPKPSYLFALVAGDLGMVEDSFETMSGRKISLRISVDKGNEDRVPHAMNSLKKAMKWDEETFGLECDLETYMIVAVDSFNFGAMENKGLNIFNSSYVLANPESATDADFLGIERVIGHEYFHNWTGNRVTCRDWFQLTLKEGLTVFRDEEFSADMNSRTVKRIQDVATLRQAQFAEDSGPMSHPIRPDSYIEINNFYTDTVYNKGAEVIRMVRNLIGKDIFRKGIDKYFELYDGQAVTTDDFIHAMEEASDKDLTQFKNWYCQAGTPICKVSDSYDDANSKYTLTFEQSCPPTPECKKKKPFCFPVISGLLNRATGEEFSIGEKGEKSMTIEITKSKESIIFNDIPSKPLPSLLREFSAPVILEYNYSEDDLIFMLTNDSDGFNRYEAGQRLATSSIESLMAGNYGKINNKLLDAFGSLIDKNIEDKAFAAQALTMPTLETIVEKMDTCDFDKAFAAREKLIKSIAEAHEDKLVECYESLSDDTYSIDVESIGRRSLKNRSLAYLVYLDEKYFEVAYNQFSNSKNMTDSLASLSLLCNCECDYKKDALSSFYDKWKDDLLVMNKWFAVQASSKLETVYDDVLRLSDDSKFDSRNPNKLRSLYYAFAGNLIHFHHASGRGYKLIADKLIEIDKFNSSVASRLAKKFNKYSKLDSIRKALMKQELERVLATPDITQGLYEVVSKTLEN